MTADLDWLVDNEDECRHLVNEIKTAAALPCHSFVQSCLSAITGRRTDKGARPNLTSQSFRRSLIVCRNRRSIPFSLKVEIIRYAI